MARYMYVRGGVVANIVEHATPPPGTSPEGDVIVPDTGVPVGTVVDLTDEMRNRQLDAWDLVIGKELLRLTNAVRALQIPSLSALSGAQYRAYLKTLM